MVRPDGGECEGIRWSMYRYKVSVCVAVYNAGRYLRDTLDSLVNQSLSGIEIICVNDGSTDNSQAILQEYAGRYTNIRIINQENTGLGGARNAGLAYATGEYVAFFDADDLARENMYEVLYHLAITENADMAMCNVEFYPDGVKTHKKVWFNDLTGEVDGNFLNKNTQPWNKIVRRELLERIGFRFFKKNGDGAFVVPMIMANKIAVSKEKLHCYRVGHESMSVSYRVDDYKVSVDCAREQIRILRQYDKYPQYEEYMYYRLILALLQGSAVAAQKGTKSIYCQFRSELRKLRFRKNPFCRKLLVKEFGIVKYVAIMHILLLNYPLAVLLTRIAL